MADAKPPLTLADRFFANQRVQQEHQNLVQRALRPTFTDQKLVYWDGANRVFATSSISIGSTLSGVGTTNTVAKFTGAETLGNSILTDNGTTVTITGALNIGSNTLTAGPTSISATGSSHALTVNLTGGGLGLIDFITAAGGGSEACTYNDSGGSQRNWLFFPGSNVVVLSSRGATSQVQIRANNSTAGAAGESTIATFSVAGGANFGSNTLTAGAGSFTSVTVSGGSFAAGRSYVDAGGGLSLGTVTGATYDWSVFTPSGGAAIIRVPTGTPNITFGGSITSGAITATSLTTTGASAITAQRSGGNTQYMTIDSESGQGEVIWWNNLSAAFGSMVFNLKNNAPTTRTMLTLNGDTQAASFGSNSLTAGAGTFSGVVSSTASVGNFFANQGGVNLKALLVMNQGGAQYHAIGSGASNDLLRFGQVATPTGAWATNAAELNTSTGALTLAAGLTATTIQLNGASVGGSGSISLQYTSVGTDAFFFNDTATGGKKFRLGSGTGAVGKFGIYDESATTVIYMGDHSLHDFRGIAATMGALTATTGTFSGQMAFNATGLAITMDTATASYKYARLLTTNGQLMWGVDDNVASLVTGSSAYASFIGAFSATALVFVTSQANRYEISSGGNHDFKSGTITGSGAVTHTGTTDSSSTSTGILVVSGGVGIAKTLYAGTGAFTANQGDTATTVTGGFSVGTNTTKNTLYGAYQGSANVGTTFTGICYLGGSIGAYYLIVFGKDSANNPTNSFIDVVLVSVNTTWAIAVLSSTNLIGTPTARSYQQSTNVLQAKVASGVTQYIVNTAAIRIS